MKILFTGDLCVGSNSPDISDNTIKYFQQFDFIISNLEGPITKSIKRSNKAGSYLKQSKEIFSFLKKLRITHLNLANNHSMDFGLKGLSDTLKSLKKGGIYSFGANTHGSKLYSYSSIKKNNISVALIGLSEMEFGVVSKKSKKGGVAWINDSSVPNLINKAKEKHDYVFVSTHAGIEYTDFPLMEWRNKYKELIDLGVDVVIGHHPHVIQGYESYKKGKIFYSLGNFIFEDKAEPGLLVSFDLKERKFKIKKRIFDFGKILSLKESNTVLNRKNKFLKLSKKSKLYRSVIYNHWKTVLFPIMIKTILLMLVLRLVPQYFFKNIRKKANTLLLHNFKIESHRYVATNYLNKIK